MDEREEFLQQRRERREQMFIDFAGTVEFANLSEDLQGQMSEDAPDWDGPTAQAGVAADRYRANWGPLAPLRARGDIAGEMFQRGLMFSASNAVADARNSGADSQDQAEGLWRGFVSNYASREEREAFTPTDEQVVEVANRWGLGPQAYEKIVNWSASEEDMNNVAEGLASLGVRDQYISDSVGPVDGFLIDFAANALNPEFLALGGVAGKAFQVGSALTRTGAAIRGAGAGFAADAPLELTRATDNPYYTYRDAALTTTMSVALGAAVGSLGNGLLRPDDLIEMQRVDGLIADTVNRQSSDLEVPGSGGSAAYNRIASGPLKIGDEGYDAPERLFTFGQTPAATLWSSQDPVSRSLADDLTWNPYRNDQGETLYELSDRVQKGAGFFMSQADDAMRAFWRENASTSGSINTRPDSPFEQGVVERVTAPVTKVLGGVTDAQAEEFDILVGQVIAGVRQSDDPHINRAAAAYADGFEDSLYYLQDSNYVGWTPGVPRAEPTGRAIPEAADLEVDRSYLPRVADRVGFIETQRSFFPASERLRDSVPNETVIKRANEQIGDRIAEVMLRSDTNRQWFQTQVERWNEGLSGKPDATGRIAPEMTLERFAQRVGRKYVQTWERLATREIEDDVTGIPTRAMTTADRNAVREIVRETFEEGEDFADEVAEAVLDLVAPAKRRTTTDSPRLMSRMDLPLDAVADRDIIGMFDWNASRLFRNYRQHVAGRAALLRKGYDGPDDFIRKADQVVENARGRGDEALRKAETERRLLLSGLSAVTGDQHIPLGKSDGDTFWRNAKFWTQGIARLNMAAYLSNTVIGPMFAEIGGVLSGAQHRLLTKMPAYRRHFRAARAGNAEDMKAGFLLADVLAGHGSSLSRSRGVAQNRFSDSMDDVSAGPSRFRQGFDEFTRKAANATARFSGMAQANDILRSVSMITDIENWSKGKVTRYQLSQAGISQEMWPRIQTLLEDLPTTKGMESGQEVLDDVAFMRRAAEADPEAFNVLIGALNRRARRLIQDPDWGHSPEWAKRPVFDLIFQFFSYPLNAINKQVVPFTRAVANKDPQALQTLFQGMFAGLGYANRVYLQSLTKDDPQEYREQRLTNLEIGKAMFYYSTVSSVAPNLMDGAVSLAEAVAPEAMADVEDTLGGSLKFSNTRASGLAATPYYGNPTVSRINTILRSSSRLIKGDDVEGSAEDLTTALLPALGNHIVTQAVINKVYEPLPGDDDED